MTVTLPHLWEHKHAIAHAKVFGPENVATASDWKTFTLLPVRAVYMWKWIPEINHREREKEAIDPNENIPFVSNIPDGYDCLALAIEIDPMRVYSGIQGLIAGNFIGYEIPVKREQEMEVRNWLKANMVHCDL